MPFAIPAINTDAMIIATVLLAIVYAVIAGHTAIARLAASIYVGLVLASTFGGIVHANTTQAAFKISSEAARLALLALPVVLIQLGHHRVHTTKHQTHFVITSLLGVLTAMLIIASVLLQLEPGSREAITKESNLASLIYSLQLWWLGLVPVAIAAVAFIRPKRH
jgi:hypothetical protein